MRLTNMRRSETTEQINLFNWAKRYEEFIPELKLMYHVPNEGKRSEGTAKVLKAAGLKKGVPDIVLPVARKGFMGLYIEMKFGKNKATLEQREFMRLLEREGHKTVIAYSFEEAREIIRRYLERGEGFNLSNCEMALKTYGCCEGVQEESAPCSSCMYYKGNREETKNVF